MNWELVKLIRQFGSEEKPINAGRLGHMLSVKQDATHGPIRFEIAQCIREGALIASTTSGYFMIETKKQLDEYIMALDRRIDGINLRKQSLRRSWKTKKEMELSEL